MDKGKALCTKIPSKSHVGRENKTNMKLSIPSEHERSLNMAFPCGASNSLPSQGRGKGQMSSNNASLLSPVSSRILNSASKGKEKIEVGPVNGSFATLNSERAIDLSNTSQHEANGNMSTSHPYVTSSRVVGRKRLVRNGCISPYNIANRAQRLTESCQVGSGSAETNQPQQIASNDASHVDIRSIVADDNDTSSFLQMTRRNHSTRNTRNELVSAASRESTSSPVFGNGVYDVDSMVNRGMPLGGWRMTRNRDANAMRRNPTLVSATSQTNGHQVVGSKRLRKHHGESSSSVHDDSDILFLGSSQGSSRLHNRQHDSSLRRNELSLETRQHDTQEVGFVDADELEARARQLEADEMLARELQEQLYHEMPVYGEEETDESIAWNWAVQQEENVLPSASTHNQPALHTVGTTFPTAPGRQTQPRVPAQTRQNPPIRRGAQARGPTSRVTQLRNRFNRSVTNGPRRRTRIPATLSRNRNLQFPLDMDLDMRIDILEALEAAVGESDSDIRHILNLQRDFNENDYDMLLSLDENNGRQGASANHINCLPESVVQSDNFSENCAICLETPSIGETIRHLPCFHKFHKDCIDPWLGRQKSCPVCKSSIT
ncbi:E3 ubiquitin-protein ligase SDIR1 [Linum grandiflorum]